MRGFFPFGELRVRMTKTFVGRNMMRVFAGWGNEWNSVGSEDGADVSDGGEDCAGR